MKELSGATCLVRARFPVQPVCTLCSCITDLNKIKGLLNTLCPCLRRLFQPPYTRLLVSVLAASHLDTVG